MENPERVSQAFCFYGENDQNQIIYLAINGRISVKFVEQIFKILDAKAGLKTQAGADDFEYISAAL